MKKNHNCLLHQMNIFGPIFFWFSCMGKKVPFWQLLKILKNCQNGTFLPMHENWVLKEDIEGGVSDWNWNLALFTQAKVSKVLNLDFHFFCIDFLGKLWKNFVTMFISRQDQKCVLIEFMHLKQDKHEFNQDTFCPLVYFHK